MNDALRADVRNAVRRLLNLFARQFATDEDPVVVRAPGRVNLLGDHTDYNEGFVLPMTIDRGAYAAAGRRADDTVRVYSETFEQLVTYSLESGPPPSAPAWSRYVTGSVEELRRRGMVGSGLDLIVSGDVPLGAGLSSSAALETAVVFGVQTLFSFELDPLDAIRLCQLVEHRYAGVECGIMDQFTSRLGRRDHALFLDCRSLEYEHVPLRLSASGTAVVIVDSRVKRELADSKYAERRAECESLVAALRRDGHLVRALRDVGRGALRRLPERLDPTLMNRATHVVEENERVKQGRRALGTGDVQAFGNLMNASHASLRDLYDVSSPELDLLVSTAQSLEGVHGARMTGGGFGGCTVNLVQDSTVDRLEERLTAAYGDEFGRELAVYPLKTNDQTELLHGGNESA